MFRSISDPWGTLLKGFRTRCHLTQQQLATAIGVHRMTISRWEEGSFLPESKELVLELAKQLHLDEQETRHFLEASLTALVPYWLVPLPRNPFFTGREDVLAELHTQLGVGQTVALAQSSALHGLGGIGKTQIALEYAYRYALEYRAVCWIGAETDEQIVTSLLRMADTLQLSERESNDQQRVVAAVQRWFSTHEQWLLIWDNVEDRHILQRFLPAARSGAMLLTTRRQALGTLARGLDLLPMEQEEGVLFLLRRAKVLTPEASREQVQQFAHRMPARYAAAVELVEVLGKLPLALDQAGAYLEETRCGPPAYLDLFRTRRDALLQRRGEDIQDHPASVATTFRLAITAAVERHPAARDLLQVCALLQPDAIPEELFCQGGEHLGPALEAVCRDPLEWDHVVSIACAYSLLSRQPEERTLSLHRLMQAVVLDGMTETEREQGNRQAIKVLNAAFPEIRSMTNYAAWRQSERLLPHALLCLRRVDEASEPFLLASLAYKAALYLRERGQYTEAEPLYQRALHILEQSHGPEYPGVATVLNNLALLYWNQGKYAEAEPLYLRALHILEQSQGPEHLEVARPLHNLALLYFQQGKHAEAESLYQRALQIKERQLGSEHLEVTLPLSSLAGLYCQQGRYMEAEPLYVRTLHIREQQLEAEHPSVAVALHNLAECYHQQGRYTEAEALYQRALRLLEQSQGPEHPDVAQALSALAKLFQEQGKQTEAEALFQRVLSIQEQQLGLHHSETAETLHNLALFRQKQGKQDEANSFAERALSIRVQSLGDTHPKTLATQTLLTHLRQEQMSIRRTAPPDLHAAEVSHPGQEQKESPPQQNALDPTSSEQDSVQVFLDACCELHPRVWCGISELWQAYGQWSVAVQRYVPLARRAFAEQLKTRGCRVDRTRTLRIWRGIRLKDQTL